jgi:hypothetical protein
MNLRSNLGNIFNTYTYSPIHPPKRDRLYLQYFFMFYPPNPCPLPLRGTASFLSFSLLGKEGELIPLRINPGLQPGVANRYNHGL